MLPSRRCHRPFLIAVLLAATPFPRAAAVEPVPVPWLSVAPVVDGVLDEALRGLPAVALPDVRAADGAGRPATVRLRLAHDARHLYLCVETDQDTLVCRDRAYQNGDGLHLALVVRADGDEPSREFHVLGFSPTDDPQQRRWRAFVWYRNVDLAMTPLRGALTAWRSAPGASSFELLLPWPDVAPLHPWLAPALGLNVCWVQAGEGTARIEHFLRYDGRLPSEQSPRLSVPLAFAPPLPGPEPAVAAAPARAHPGPGEPPLLAVAGLAAADCVVTLALRVETADSAVVVTSAAEARAGPRPSRQEIPLELPPLPPGDYVLRWRATAGDWEGSTPLSLLPPFDAPADSARVAALAGSLDAGTVATLAFAVADLRERLRALRPYDAARGLPAAVARLRDDLAAAGAGRDPLAGATGVLRRAFRSALDGALRPYSLRVPEGHDPARPAPLLVWLHGSGVDDRGQLDEPRAPAGWLELAPHGRGTSHAWSTDEAQADLREALADVEARYAVDPARIVLAGFSMGGYGVYRTHWQTPGRFRALAVFSGSPDLATRWLGPGHPDFRDPAALSAFRDVPIFIFHGARDRNCPVELTEDLVAKLRAAGARVEFVLAPYAGHERPGENVREAFREWLAVVSR